MLNPLTGFEPGMLVTYHGTLTALHGQYQAYPCTCLSCDDPILGPIRYQLVSSDDGTVIDCVRPRSITPAPEDDDQDERAHEECLGIHTSADGYRDCDGRLI